ncbi:hypothetical protein [Natrinema saccharevitans]|nr:hypothetical protein [Natrinema saccharevitans]
MSDTDETDAFDDVRDLLERGLSASEAIDYYATEVRGYSQADWADVRDKSRQAVNKNVRQARRKQEPGAVE